MMRNLLLVLLLTAPSLAQGPVRTWEGLPLDNLGSSLACPGDIDGDGTADLLVGKREWHSDRGKVLALSPRTGEQLYEVGGLFHQTNLGSDLITVDDLDQDGVAEAIARGDEYFLAFSGKTGATSWTYEHEEIGNLAAPHAISDVNGDGLGDWAWIEWEVGLHVHDVLTGQHLMTIPHIGTDAAWFFASVLGYPDVNGDGIDEILLGAWWDHSLGGYVGTIWVFSGADGSWLSMLTGEVGGAALGLEMKRTDDLDGDGFPEIVTGRWNPRGVRAMSVITGETLWTHLAPDGSFDYPGHVQVIADQDGDGWSDVIASHALEDDESPVRVEVLSGVDGQRIGTLVGDQGDRRPFAAMVAIRDVGGGPWFDLAVGSVGEDPWPGFVELYQDVSRVVGLPVCSEQTPNGTGEVGRLAAHGDLVLANSDLTLVGWNLPPGQVGRIVAGQGTTPFQPPGASTWFCLAGEPLFSPLHVVTDPTGQLREPLDLTLLPLAPGETWGFQLWHREPPGGDESALTDAVEVTFR